MAGESSQLISYVCFSQMKAERSVLQEGSTTEVHILSEFFFIEVYVEMYFY